MKVAIVNDIHIGMALIHQGIQRASSHLLEAHLPRILEHVQRQHQPDLCINLGDLIRSASREDDFFLYERGISHFKSLNCPVIHLLGNHDIKRLTIEEVEALWKRQGFDQESYGTLELDGVRIVWLGLECDPRDYHKRRLPSAQLVWLRDILESQRMPTLLFSHCAIDDHNVDGNFFHSPGAEKSGFFLENQERIQRIIYDCQCVRGVFQAHLHYFHTRLVGGIPHFTCPAMADNICGPNIEDNIPEIYTIATFEPDQHITVKAYSREFCFAGAEF